MFILFNLLFIVIIDSRFKLLVVFISTGTLLKWEGGSVTLFIIYINDVPHASDIFNSIMYADDTTISTTLQTIKSIYPTQSVSTSLNNELVKISDWLSINKLSINVKKSKYLLHKMNNTK